jgi:hypothetical protein
VLITAPLVTVSEYASPPTSKLSPAASTRCSA